MQDFHSTTQPLTVEMIRTGNSDHLKALSNLRNGNMPSYCQISTLFDKEMDQGCACKLNYHTEPMDYPYHLYSGKRLVE